MTIQDENLSQDIGEIKGKQDLMLEILYRMDKQLNGNGHAGLIKETESLKTDYQNHCVEASKRFEEIQEKQGKMLEVLTELKTSVNLHLADKKAHSMLSQIDMKFVSIMAGAVVFLIVVIPREVTIWNLIATWLHLK